MNTRVVSTLHYICLILQNLSTNPEDPELVKFNQITNMCKQEFVDMLNLKPGQKVLDVGCGIGGGDFYMAKVIK